MKLSAPALIPSYGQGFNRFPASPGLSGLWATSLGPTGATLYDQGPNKCHGNLTGMAPATDWVSDTRWSWVLDYDEVNDQVVIPYKQNLTIGLSDFTILAWVRLNGPAAVRHPVAVGQDPVGLGGWQLRVSDADAVNQATRHLNMYGDAGAIAADAANGSMPFNTWVHAAATRVNALVTLYQDGVPVAVDATGGADLDSVVDWTIAGVAARFWLGPIGDVTYYRRGLSQTEILEHMHDPHLLLREAA